MGSQENYENMKRCENIFKRTTKEAKKSGWKNFCSSITRETPLTNIWKMAKIFKGTGRSTNSSEDHEEWIEEFMDKHSQAAPCNSMNFDELIDHKNSFFDTKITTKMINEKIAKLKKSAPGIDKIREPVDPSDDDSSKRELRAVQNCPCAYSRRQRHFR